MMPRNEFSRPIALDGLGRQARSLEIVARPDERAALARRFALLELPALSATLSVRRERGGLISVAGRLSATVVQSCVVTLEPVRQSIEQDFQALYSEAPEPEAAGEVVIDPEGADAPEPLPPDGLDLGETVAEQLALALDPYPRAEGAQLEPAEDSTDSKENIEKSESSGPFSKLASLKRRD